VTVESLVFFFLAAFAVTTAVLMVVQRSPLVSAIYLIANFFALAALYLLLRAQLLAVLQIVVYTGAIMVLVVFVIMLLNLEEEGRVRTRIAIRTWITVVLAAGFLSEIVYVFFVAGTPAEGTTISAGAESLGTVESMGEALFGKFLLPFEITSLLLLTAILGAVVLAKRKG
jgi:NADH-quinone oxidoreductase subunit J